MVYHPDRVIIVLNKTEANLLNDDKIQWVMDYLDEIGSHSALEIGDGIKIYLPSEQSDEEQFVIHLKCSPKQR